MTTRILVIDADLSAARQVCRLLEAAGHQARVCTSESQAVEVLTSSALQRLAVGAVEGAVDAAVPLGPSRVPAAQQASQCAVQVGYSTCASSRMTP